MTKKGYGKVTHNKRNAILRNIEVNRDIQKKEAIKKSKQEVYTKNIKDLFKSKS
jgi:hypothetical protein